MTDAYSLLSNLSDNDPAAREEFAEAVYREIHQLARNAMTKERGDHTLQATALVNEVWLRLFGGKDVYDFPSRQYFYGAVGQTMRQILVGYARGKNAARRGYGVRPTSLSEASDAGGPDPELSRCLHYLEVNDVEEKLMREGKINARAKCIFDLIYWAGKTQSETAADLAIPPTTVQRVWTQTLVLIGDELKRAE